MINEKEIILRILKGDKRAFSLLVDEYKRLIFHVVRRMVNDRDEVEDVCQEVFIKIYKHIGSFSHKSKLSTWIARIAYLASVDHLKKNKSHIYDHYQESDHHHLAENDSTPDELLEQKDLSQYLNLLMLELPENYKMVLTLYHLEEFSIQEIESILNMPAGTVKSCLFRARALLKEKVKRYLKNDNAKR
jgi:RNA polymerase sigma factor (sigma-70 family)